VPCSSPITCPWAGDQAFRRSAFQEAIVHLGKAIEMADKAVGATAGSSDQHRELHVACGNALIAARGYRERPASG
jgi:hypothetical protein